MENLKYKILKVDPSSYSLSVPEDFSYDKKINKINGETNVTVDIDTGNDLLKITVSINMKCLKRENDEILNELFFLKSASTYRIENFAQYILNEEKLEVEQKVLEHFIDISINHTRGMQSAYLKGSNIAKFVMPRIETNGFLADAIKIAD